MSITNYKIKGYDGNYYDISGVFSNKTSAVTVASTNPYKYSTTTNILNNFEIYSDSGAGHPLQTNVTGYKINNIDISKYYTPYYGVKDGSQTQSSIPIPNWASKVSFIIQAAGGINGSNSTGSQQIVYNIAYHRYTMSGFNHYYTPYPTVNQSFVTTKNLSSGAWGFRKQGKIYNKASTSYTGGAGSGGTCYAGTYTINNTNRPSGMTYTSNNGSTSYLQFNDITNNSTVTVPNGTTGGNATSTQNGAPGGTSPIVTFINSSYFPSGNSYTSSTTTSGYSQNPTINNTHPLPTSASFTGRGGSTQTAFFIYWFLI